MEMNQLVAPPLKISVVPYSARPLKIYLGSQPYLEKIFTPIVPAV